MGRTGKAPALMAKKGKQKDEATLGKALQRRQTQQIEQRRNNSKGMGEEGPEGSRKYVSVLEATSLEDFIATAMLGERDFDVQKANTVILDGETGEEVHIDSHDNRIHSIKQGQQEEPAFAFEQMSVPRRPKWDENTTREDLDKKEREAFIEWRREIARLEEQKQGLKVTPFEKNLEVWKQLWRVLERSDLVVQIVDARNPLFYYSKDLLTYAGELTPPKPVIILVNKSDYLTAYQRKAWVRHFKSLGWEGLFFSARASQAKLNREARLERGLDIPEEEKQSVHTHDVHTHTDSNMNEYEKEVEIKSRVLEREELSSVLEELTRKLCAGQLQVERNQGRVCVGMVGYPNVGKSSVINVLVGATPFSHGVTRVSVGSTPGKTKHFQTLVLSDTLMLCDCPGLVFPSFVSSSAEMVCAGVLPIMQMKDAIQPIALIARRIPRHILELTYTITLPEPIDSDLHKKEHTHVDDIDSIHIHEEKDIHVDTHANVDVNTRTDADNTHIHEEGASEKLSEPSGSLGLGLGQKRKLRPPTAMEILVTICETRHLYRAASLGDADAPRAARLMLSDYTEGKLLYCHPPPDLQPEDENTFCRETERTHLASSRLLIKLETQQKKLGLLSENSTAHAHTSTTHTDIDTEELTQKLKERAEAIRERDLLNIEGGVTKAEQGFRRWGKKSKKFRDKTPYEPTGRMETAIGGGTGKERTVSAGACVNGAKLANKKGPRGTVGGEGAFVRAVLPHHPSYEGP